MTNLKYLFLDKNINLASLPNSIVNLNNLETLGLRDTGINSSDNLLEILRQRGVINIIVSQPYESAVFVDSPVVSDIATNEECPICQENLNENSPVIVSKEDKKMDQPIKCGHKFHRKCIEKWMRGKEEPPCPSCRAPIVKYYPIKNGDSVGGRKTRTKNYKKKNKNKTKKYKKVYSKKSKYNSKKLTKRCKPHFKY